MSLIIDLIRGFFNLISILWSLNCVGENNINQSNTMISEGFFFFAVDVKTTKRYKINYRRLNFKINKLIKFSNFYVNFELEVDGFYGPYKISVNLVIFQVFIIASLGYNRYHFFS